ncbi:protein of unknown function [Pararobbsia alpina]
MNSQFNAVCVPPHSHGQLSKAFKWSIEVSQQYN